jgi:anti-sigma B factor antagonist
LEIRSAVNGHTTTSSGERRSPPRFARRRRKSASWPCPRPSEFSILVVFDLHDVVLQLSGDLDVAHTDHLERCVRAALEEGPRRLIFDLSGLDFAGVAAVRALVHASHEAARVGAGTVLAAASPLMRHLIELGGVEELFTLR